MSEETNNSIKYNHKDAKEMQAFLAKIRTKTRNKGSNVLAVYNHAINHKPHGLDADALKTANIELYDISSTTQQAWTCSEP